MDRNLYVALTSRAAGLVDAGQYPEALDIFEEIVASDLGDVDKSMMCINLAVVHDKMGQRDQALTSYGRALAYERPTGAYFAEQHRAAYFSQIGMYAESIECYLELLARTDLKATDRDAFSQNVATLEKLRD